MSKVEHGLAFGIPKFYIDPYDKINHILVNLSYNCDLKSGLRLMETTVRKLKATQSSYDEESKSQ